MAIFQTVTGKLGNMRKAASWVVYPQDAHGVDNKTVVIQCDRRIAKISLETGKAIVSDGKGGHPAFFKLSPSLGATVVQCPADLLDALRAIKPQVGPISLF